MSSLRIPILVGLLVAPLAVHAAGDPKNASDWIERVNEMMLPTHSMLATGRLVTRDGFGGESVVTFEMARISEDGVRQTLIEARAPDTKMDSVYQIVNRGDGDPVRWVWLSEVRRLRRVRGVERTDPFLGSYFTYEDIGLAAPVERKRGEIREIVVSDRPHIELVSQPYHLYGKVVTIVNPVTGLPVIVRFYDRAGELFREQRFEDIVQIRGQLFPMRIVMRDVETGGGSILTFDEVAFDVDIPQERFTRSRIVRILRGHEGSDSLLAELVAGPSDAQR